jgi:hypothetical protein
MIITIIQEWNRSGLFISLISFNYEMEMPNKYISCVKRALKLNESISMQNSLLKQFTYKASYHQAKLLGLKALR